jgi:GTPase SAR1 family protein
LFIFIKWIPEIKSNPFYKDVPILLVGTKADEKNIMKFKKITLQSSGESVIPSFEASLNDSIDSFEGMEMTRSFLENQSEHNSPKISNILDLML